MKKFWIVTLAAPAIVNNVLRQPVEGSLTVTEEEAERLHAAGALAADPEPVGEDAGSDAGSDAGDDDDGLDDMLVADLHILVTKEGVPLNDATKKADIIAAIRTHRAKNAA